MNGGQPAIRGYLAQTLIALLEALDDDQRWTSVTLEPNVDSHKVDILWQYPDRAKAVQVKSSQNPFAEADIRSSARSSSQEPAPGQAKGGATAVYGRAVVSVQKNIFKTVPEGRQAVARGVSPWEP